MIPDLGASEGVSVGCWDIEPPVRLEQPHHERKLARARSADMTGRNQKLELSVAVCADAPEDVPALKDFIKRGGHADSGCTYRPEDWRNLVEAAKARKFNAVLASFGGLRWFARLVPESSFKRTETKPRRPSPVSREPLTGLDALVVQRATEMMKEHVPQSTEAIAHSMGHQGLLTGSVAAMNKKVRHALLGSGGFSVEGDNNDLWRPWKPRTGSSVDPSGTRILCTQVLSTTGVPVNLTVPLKPITPELVNDVARILAEVLVKDLRKSDR